MEKWTFSRKEWPFVICLSCSGWVISGNVWRLKLSLWVGGQSLDRTTVVLSLLLSYFLFLYAGHISIILIMNIIRWIGYEACRYDLSSRATRKTEADEEKWDPAGLLILPCLHFNSSRTASWDIAWVCTSRPPSCLQSVAELQPAVMTSPPFNSRFLYGWKVTYLSNLLCWASQTLITTHDIGRSVFFS